jgi:Domain of unknown function (DUF1835)
MTRQADFKRRVRARMAKTGESYAAARAQLVADPGRTLHVTNGDSTVASLARTGLAEHIVPWRDMLHEGPVPAVPESELRRVRAAFLAEHEIDHALALRLFEERDRALADNRHGRFALWFEADLYDQLQIIQILARLAALRVDPPRISLICIGEYPGIAHFGGLGELEPEQLLPLPAAAGVELSPAALRLATDAWAAFRAPQPSGIGAIARAQSPELRFLAEAFDRLGREYPSTRDGLALTERRILAAAAEGRSTAGAIFLRLGEREARPYLGDTWAFAIMERLARAPTPLLAPAPAGRVTFDTPLELTSPGRAVLAGEADHVALNGIDRWIGGVHLTGPEAAWRWDEGTESIPS